MPIIRPKKKAAPERKRRVRAHAQRIARALARTPMTAARQEANMKFYQRREDQARSKREAEIRAEVEREYAATCEQRDRLAQEAVVRDRLEREEFERSVPADRLQEWRGLVARHGFAGAKRYFVVST